MQAHKNVLIIEDEPAWRELLGQWLKDAGYIPEYAADFATASDKILKHTSWFAGFGLSLCVVDLRLASSKDDNFEGIGLLAMCKIINVPTIAVTAHLAVGMKEQLRQFGAFDSVDKSTFNGPEFLQVIERALALRVVTQDPDRSKSTRDQNAFETQMQSMIEVVEGNYERATNRINTLYNNNLTALGKRETDEDVAEWKAKLKQLEESRKDLIGQLALTSSLDQLIDIVPKIRKVAASW